MRFTRPGFTTLTRIILGQQVSRAAARSVLLRLEEQVGGAITPEAILRLSESKLRAGGFVAPENHLHHGAWQKP